MLRYGRMFLKAVQGFVKENPGQIIKPGTDTVPSEKNTSRKRAKGRSLAETGQLARQGLSFSQIAERRGLKTSTISEHLELLFKEKHTIDIDCHVNPQKRQDIEKAFQRMGTEFLRPIVEHLKGRVSYDEARVVRGYLIGRAKGGRRNADLSTSSG
jgi:ATP-dependent DNA helicase RecQ